MVCVNTLTSVDSSVYLTHNLLWYEMGRDFGSKGENFGCFTPERFSIDNARNTAAKIALEQECDYLFFIDDDMILAPNTYKSLREADKDIVMALTVIRGYPFQPMHFIEPFETRDTNREIMSLVNDNDFAKRVDSNGLVEVDAIGCACVLFKTWMFKEMEPPYFVTLPKCTEDVYFCMKAKAQLGREKVKIYVDTKVPTGHLGTKPVYDYANREKFMQAHEIIQGKPKERKDRGNGYAAQVDAL